MTTICVEEQRGYWRDSQARCRAQPGAKERQKANRNRTRENELAKMKRADPKQWATQVLANLRHRAKKRGLEFSITASDICIPAVCPVLGIPIVLGTGRRAMSAPGSPSVDRFDNMRGYTPDNIRVISNRANILKRDATVVEIRLVLAYLEGGVRATTTVAFKDGVMASDSKCTDEFSAFVTRTPKMWRLPSGALLGQAGDADIRDVIDLLSSSTPKKLPSRAALAALKMYCSLILAFPNGKVFLIDIGSQDVGSMDSEWTASVVEIEERMYAIGSGQQFALGAMAAGRSASEAVHIACRYDSLSQPPVKEVHVKQSKRKASND